MKRAHAAFCGLILLGVWLGNAHAWDGGARLLMPRPSSSSALAAAWDGKHGAYVVWQDDSGSTAGILRVQHLVESGGIDPSWPVNGKLLCPFTASRTQLGMVADDQGGAFVWWFEGYALYLSRLSERGTLAPGWPSRGRRLTSLVLGTRNDRHTPPEIVPDGNGGVFVGWLDWTRQFLVTHLDAENLPAPGWPDEPVAVNQPGASTLPFIAALGRGESGEVIAAWVQSNGGAADPTERTFHLRRLFDSPNALMGEEQAAGRYFSSDGSDVDAIFESCVTPLAVSSMSDGRVEMLRWEPVNSRYGGGQFVIRRFDVDGTEFSSVMVEALYGAPLGFSTHLGARFWLRHGPDESLDILAPGLIDDGLVRVRDLQVERGGSWWGNNYLKFWSSTSVALVDGSDPELPLVGVVAPVAYADPYHGNSAVVSAYRLELGRWASQAMEYNLGLSLEATPLGYGSYQERWFASAAVASTRDGGAMVLWSQLKHPLGIMVARLGPVFGVAEVGPGGGRSGNSSRVSFAHGVGVQVLGAPPGAEVALFDLLGSRMAGGRVPDSDAVWTIPGSSSIASGVYFARIEWAGQQLTRRVVVLR